MHFFSVKSFSRKFLGKWFHGNFCRISIIFLQIFSACSVTMPLRMWSSSWRWYRSQCFALCLKTWKSRNGGRYHRCFVRTFEIRFYLQVTMYIFWRKNREIDFTNIFFTYEIFFFFWICRTVVRRHLRYNWGYGEKLKPIINQFPKDELPKTLKKFLAYEPWKRKDIKTIEISIFIARLFR